MSLRGPHLAGSPPRVAPLVPAPARQASAIVAAVATASTANAGRACSDPEYPGLPAW